MSWSETEQQQQQDEAAKANSAPPQSNGACCLEPLEMQPPYNEQGNNENEQRTNERLLGIAFFSFMSFSLTQLLFAFVADSEAMKGDSAAMIVDSITYLFNYVAEKRKQVPVSCSDARIRQRTQRKKTLQLEIVPPILSVSTLIVVTIFVTYKAVTILNLDMHRSIDQQSRPNLSLMLGFSIFNLLLDIVNVGCFSQSHHLCGYTAGACPTHQHHYQPVVEANGLDPCDHNNDDSDEQAETNLNMCSAYTHVFADTLRSIAVIVASVIAEVLDEVTPEEADATAAIVVSFLICLTLIPLIQGLLGSVSELNGILAEELVEKEAAGLEPSINGGGALT